MTTTRPVDHDRHPAQWLALAVGIAYTLIGLAGFAVTGVDDLASPDGALLLGFEVNPLHNVVHLLIGAAGLAMWNRLGGARTYGWALVVIYGLTLVYGLVVDHDDPANILAINTADNWLHAISVVAGLVIALWPARDRAVGTGQGTTLATDQRHARR